MAGKVSTKDRSALTKTERMPNIVPSVLSAVPVKKIHVEYFKIPTETPESDGTLAWNNTGLVLVSISAGNETGLGYSYADLSTALFIHEHLSPLIEGKNAFDIPGCLATMYHNIRNLGRPGITSMAISAVDNALWDLKARLLRIPLCKLLGQVHDGVPIYGSGGFTDYTPQKLQQQMQRYAKMGLKMAKIKIGSHPEKDPERVKLAKKALGKDASLFVDANGAFSRKQALKMASIFAESGVTWFEEPVSSDDLEGLHLIRDQGPGGINIAAGEYGYDPFYFRKMLQAQAIDVLQADATRCGGISGFIKVGASAESFSIPFSSHTAPALHLHVACSIPGLVNMEYFFDHVRIENMLFEGCPRPENGKLFPDISRPGNGLDFKEKDAKKFKVS